MNNIKVTFFHQDGARAFWNEMMSQRGVGSTWLVNPTTVVLGVSVEELSERFTRDDLFNWIGHSANGWSFDTMGWC